MRAFKASLVGTRVQFIGDLDLHIPLSNVAYVSASWQTVLAEPPALKLLDRVRNEVVAKPFEVLITKASVLADPPDWGEYDDDPQFRKVEVLDVQSTSYFVLEDGLQNLF